MIFQEAVCSHEYQKNCFIEYNKVAKEYDVERCHQGMQRDCDLPGETVCTIEAEVGETSCLDINVECTGCPRVSRTLFGLT